MSSTLRSLSPFFLGLAVALGTPSGLQAQSEEQVRELGQKEIEALVEAAKNEPDPAKRAELYRKATERQAEIEGMVGKINSASAQIEGQEASAERDREIYDKPGFWDKVGDKAIDVIGDMISKLFDNWINGGGEDDALLAEIEGLQDERDRLLDERNNPNPGEGDNGLGRIITDSTGAYGYDRDGDGFVDIPIENGEPGAYNPSNDDAYASGGGSSGLDPMQPPFGNGLTSGLDPLNPLNDDDDDPLYPGFFGGGGGTPGLRGGGGGGGGPQPPGAGANDPLAGGAGGDDDDGDDLASANEDGGTLEADGDEADGLKDDQVAPELETVIGRVIVLPKLEVEMPSGDLKSEGEGDEWEDEWEDDGWDDARDNGDKTPSGSDASQDEAQVVDQIIRVETVILSWRKAEKSADPYAEKDEEFSGYQAPGAEEEDSLAAVRDADGKVDLSKVEVWLIAKDTWKEGQEPLRYRVELGEDVRPEEFEPVHGGVLVVRGALKALPMDERVLEEISGEVKALEVGQVILSAEKPPEDDEEAKGEELPKDPWGEDAYGEDDGW